VTLGLAMAGVKKMTTKDVKKKIIRRRYGGRRF